MRSCPRCKSSDYNNRQFILMINECGHSLCRNCVESIFARNSAPCPQCGKTLRKNTFWEQQFDDPIIEKDSYFRKKLRKTFCLKEDDFPSLKDYNDYLEMFEEIVWNRVMDLNVEETLKKIETFEKDYAELIERNKNRRSQDEEWIARMIKEDEAFKNRTQSRRKCEMVENVKESTSQEGLINELIRSDLPADMLIEKQKKKFKVDTQEGPQYLPFQESTFNITKPLAAGSPYEYEELVLSSLGPPLPLYSALGDLGFLRNIKSAGASELAGGYTESIACYRALGDAYCDLYYL